MSMLGLMIFLVQSTAFAYFYTHFLRNTKKQFNFIAIIVVFNLVIEPVALYINNSYITIPFTMVSSYILLRCLFREETKIRCILAVIFFESVMIVCEIISLTFLLLGGVEPQPAVSKYTYAIGFYILHYVLMILGFTLIIHFFGSEKFVHRNYILWEMLLMGVQIISCIIMTAFYYDMNIVFLLVYSILFFIVTIFSFQKMIIYQEKRKQEMALYYLQKQLQKQCESYIALKNQEQFRKLRHDYINFIEQRNIY